jgi:nicotinamide-nucleotide amidase
MRVEVICTGDEVLTGKIVNSNFATISQKLEDAGLAVSWETTVGDDRDSLLAAFRLAGERADAVIVNGGLGPTVDDLSQEIAAQAAGVGLALNEEWLSRMEEFFTRRGRAMPPNNRKQAMLPAGAEMIDNPIGTACGFAVDIGRGRFYFTPGVPRELRRMLDEQIVPRLLEKSGVRAVIRLKRFHSYGIGESHADQLLAGVEALAADHAAPGNSIKLGFRAHYPELETKLTLIGRDEQDVERRLAPVVAEVRKRLGSFIVAEDDDTLERVVLERLAAQDGRLAIAEMFTGGHVASRLAALPRAAGILRRSTIALELGELCAALGVEPARAPTRELAVAIAQAARREARATHGLACLIALDDGPDRIDFGADVVIAIAAGDPGTADERTSATRASRVVGGRDWIRLGGAEMALDCLRRHLQGLPVEQANDFERPAVRRS